MAKVTGLLIGLSLVLVVPTLSSADPALRCQARKADAASKYAACITKKTGKAALRGTTLSDAERQKCLAKLTRSFARAENLGSGACATPPGPDPANVVAAMDSCANWASSYATGSTPSTCPVESCSDSIANQDETDVDCGGATCPGCANGESCSINTDCTSGNCQTGTCAAPSSSFKRVFVTSTLHQGDFSTGTGVDGFARAGSICQALADAQSLGGTWTAWLSTRIPQVHAKDRITDAEYRLVDGVTVVANDLADLTDGSLAVAILQDETDTTIPTSFGQDAVWTGTQVNGDADPSLDCQGWTVNVNTVQGRIGAATLTTGGWTNVGFPNCDANAHLYCFED